MIYTGIDLVEIDRIRRSIKNPKFLSRIFSSQELKFFSQKAFNEATIAANFCAKEAFAKALGTGMRGFSLNEVSILRDSVGAPYISLEGKAKEIVAEKKLKLSVSLSHTRIYATAIIIAFTD